MQNVPWVCCKFSSFLFLVVFLESGVGRGVEEERCEREGGRRGDFCNLAVRVWL